MREQLINYIRAAYPLIYCVTYEEQRIEADLKAAAEKLGFRLHSWSVTDGLVDLTTGQTQDVQDPIDCLARIRELPEKSLVVLRDYHAFLGDANQPVNPLVSRTLRDLARSFKARQKAIVITAPLLRLPPELEKEMVVLDHALPGKPELSLVLDNIAESAGLGKPDGQDRENLLDAALGLTTQEAENALALSYAEKSRLDHTVVSREKTQAVRKSGLLELWEPTGTLDDIGGLDLLKAWLLERKDAFSSRARDYGLPLPKSVLLIGPPGTGKSASAKATAVAWQVPLLRLDMGRIYGSLVGDSERNLRQVIQLIEAIGKTVVLIEEIDKALSGSQGSGGSDGGTSARVLGGLLTWLQEKTSPAFLIASGNDVSALPPELLRAGRFDAMFCLDLPGPVEREQIFAIHLRKRGRDPQKFDLSVLSQASDGFSGAEIEASIVTGMFAAFGKGQEIETSHIGEAVRQTVPLSVTAREKIAATREWARTRARPATSTPAPTTKGSSRRLQGQESRTNGS